MIDREARRLLQEAADMLDVSRYPASRLYWEIHAYLDSETPDEALVQRYFVERKADKCGDEHVCSGERCGCLEWAQRCALFDKKHPEPARTTLDDLLGDW